MSINADFSKARQSRREREEQQAQAAAPPPATVESITSSLQNSVHEIDLAPVWDTVSDVAGGIAGVAESVGNAISGWGDAYSRVLETSHEAQAAYDPAVLQEANATGDYSRQEAAVKSMQQAGSEFTQYPKNTISMAIEEAAQGGSEFAQNLRSTDAYLSYFMTDENKLLKAKEIEKETGIPAEAMLDDDEALKEGLKVYDYTRKARELGGDSFSMDMVWKEYPELGDISKLSASEAAIALHNIGEVRTTHGIIESFTHSWEQGNKELEYGNIQFKIMTGTADDDDVKRAAQLEKEIDEDKKTNPSFFDNPAAAIAGGVAGSAPEMTQMLSDGIKTGLIWGMIVSATTATAGTAVGGPAGTVAGGAAGAVGGFTSGFAAGVLRSALIRSAVKELAKTTLKGAFKKGMSYGMLRTEAGQGYAEYGELKDENGNPALSEGARTVLSLLRGAVYTKLEMGNTDSIMKTFSGAPHAGKVFSSIIGDNTRRLAAKEEISRLAREKAADMFKITLSESAEEAAQTAAGDVIHNAAVAYSGALNNEFYSINDIGAHAFTSFAESLPASMGFGAISTGGGTVTGSYRIRRAMSKQAQLTAAYGEEARKTMTGTIMLEQLQQTVAENNFKEKSPDTQRKVLREQLSGTGFENAYIDVETALEKENGMKDLQEVAKAANISKEELQTAIEEKGHILVPVEQFAQAKSSSELLESVTFSPEADSMARMKKSAADTMESYEKSTKQAIERQMQLVDNIVSEYTDKLESGNKEDIKDMMRAVILTDPANPARGWSALEQDLHGQLREILAPVLEEMQGGMGKGGYILEVRDELDNAKYIRGTDNAKWYSDFYKANKRAPRVQELEDMAAAAIMLEGGAPQLNYTATIEAALQDPELGKEVEAQLNETRETIRNIQKMRDILESIKPAMKSLTGIEMQLTEGLSKEAFHIYRDLTEKLQQAGAANVRAARMDAILFARHADIYADIIRKKTGKEYTAEDYYDYGKRFRLDVAGEVQGTYNQAMQQDIEELFKGIRTDKDEQVQNLDKLLESKPIELKSYGFEDIEDVRERWAAGKEVFADLYQDKSKPRVNGGFAPKKFKAADGTEISVPMKALKEIKNHGTKNITSYIASNLQEIIENSVFLYEADMMPGRKKKLNKSTLGYRCYGVKANTPYGEVYIKSVVRMDINGNVYYDAAKAEVSEIKEAIDFHSKPDYKSGEKKSMASGEAVNSRSQSDSESGDQKLTTSFIENSLADWAQKVKIYQGFKSGKNDLIFSSSTQNNSFNQMAGQPPMNSLGIPMNVVTEITGEVSNEACAAALKELAGMDLPNHIENVTAQVNREQREKILSGAAKRKSNDNGFSDSEHTTLARQIKDLWLYAVKSHEEEEKSGQKKDIYIERYAAPARINGKDAFVWFTVKNSAKIGRRIYSLEIMDAEKLRRTVGTAYENHRSSTPLRSFDEIISKLQEYGKSKNTQNDIFNQRANGIKGQLQTFLNGRRVITLFETADESTFLHEMGHLFLMDLEDLAKIDDVSAKELATVKEWAKWGKGASKEYKGTPWEAEFAKRHNDIVAAIKLGDEDTKNKLLQEWEQERFARAFEMYLRDGKAPAKGLRAVFRKFKTFLHQIYVAFSGGGGRASEPVRRIMDRMIATDEEIKEMDLDDRYKDITKAGGEKLFTETEEETYQRWREEATEEAKEKLLKIVMEDLKEEYKTEFEKAMQLERNRKRHELESKDVYLAAKAVMETGDESLALNWHYTSIEDFMKEASNTPDLEKVLDEHMEKYSRSLDEELIKEKLSDDAPAKAMERTVYQKKLQEFTAAAFAKKIALQNKITEKTARAMDSVEEKLAALPEETELKLEKDSPAVKALTKAINQLRFSAKWAPGDFTKIDSMLKAASKEEMAAAIKALKQSLKEDKTNINDIMKANEGRLKFYREAARRAVQGMPLSQACSFALHMNEAKKIAKNVQLMCSKGNWEMALRLQQQYAMKMAVAEESQKLRDKVEGILKQVKKQLNARSVKLPQNERYWHRHLAYLLRLIPKDVERPEGVQSLKSLFDAMDKSLDLQEFPDDILDMIDQKGENFRGYQSLNFSEFKEAMDVLIIIYTTGRNKFNMVTIGGKSIRDVMDEILSDDTGIASSVITHTRAVEADTGGLFYNDVLSKVPGIGKAISEKGQAYMLAMTKPEDILRRIGEKAHRYIYGTYERAAEKEGEMTAAAVKKLEELLKPYSHSERREWKKEKYKLRTKYGNEKFTKENIICIALNMGNEANISRVAKGLGLNEQVIWSFLDENMEAKDWQLVQNIWDYFNSYWQETVEIETKLNGSTLEKVEAKPFTAKLPDGTEIEMRGGYYPISYDPEKSDRASEQEINMAAESMMSGQRVLGSKRGFTKHRTEAEIDRPLLFKFEVTPNHVQSVIHNIAFRLAARDVYRLVSNKDFSAYVRSTLGAEAQKVLEEWATDVWAIMPESNNRASGWFNNMFRALQRNSVMAIMGYRIWPVIENVSNIAGVMDKLGAVKGITAVANFYGHRKAFMEMMNRSVFMRNRINEMDRDIGSRENLFEADFRAFEIMRSHAYDLMLYSDLALSAPLWCQSYKDSLPGTLREVTLENEENKRKVREAQENIDSIKAKIIDNNKKRGDIKSHLSDRVSRTPDALQRAQTSPFAVYHRDELVAGDLALEQQTKDLKQELFKAEQEADNIMRLEILDDAEILKEAEQRAVEKADGAVRDVFGSGRAMDLTSVQRSKNMLVKSMTAFYSFFSTQMNAILSEYHKGKFGGSTSNILVRYAPMFRSIMYRMVLANLIGASLKYALGLEGGGDDDKWEKVKNKKTGKTEERAVPWQERYFKVLGKNLLSTATGGFIGLRDVAGIAISQLFDGTTYGRNFNPVSVALAGKDDLAKAFNLITSKTERQLEIEEKKKKQKKNKNIKIPHEITNAEIARHAMRTVAYAAAARTGLTTTMTDSITGTMQYLLDTEKRYDSTWRNMIWSALFDKKPVEKPKEHGKKKKKK